MRRAITLVTVAGALVVPAAAQATTPLAAQPARFDRSEGKVAKVRSPRPDPVSPQLQAIAVCESHGNPRAIDASGTYRGKYQFDLGTWRSVGGHGDPAAASEAEQDRRAQRLLERSGTAPWPVCGD